MVLKDFNKPQSRFGEPLNLIESQTHITSYKRIKSKLDGLDSIWGYCDI